MTARPPRRSIEAADAGRHRARYEQADRQAAEHQALAPARVGRDRLAEHAQRIERGAPGEDLGDAERQHGVRGGVAQEAAERASAPRPASCAPASSSPWRRLARLADTSAPFPRRIMSTGRGGSAPDIRWDQEGQLDTTRTTRKRTGSQRAGGALRQGRHQRRRGGGAGRRPAAVRPRRRRRQNAAALAAALGGLKGPIMKVAQLLATIPEALPAEYAAASSRSCSRRRRRWGRRSCAGA